MIGSKTLLTTGLLILVICVCTGLGCIDWAITVWGILTFANEELSVKLGVIIFVIVGTAAVEEAPPLSNKAAIIAPKSNAMQGIIISQIWPDDNPAVLNFINSFVEFKWVLLVLFPGVVVEIVWIISSDIAGFLLK